MFARVALPILILIAGIGGWVWLSDPVPTPKPEHGERKKIKTERLVLKPTDYQIILDSQGTVRAHHSTTLTPLVSGRIIKIHPGFEDGAFFKEGEVLAEIDPSDLEAKVTGAESSLARAEANLAREEARAKQAKLNWEDIGYEEEPSPLVLREPQLKEARALVTAAQADLDQAQRDLARAKVRAPFDGRVKTRSIGLGQAVNATTPLGEVFATDIAEVRLPLAPGQLRFIQLPTHKDDPPVAVTLTNSLGRTTPGEEPTWEARIIRTEGALDEKSRELFAIAQIEDPFGLIEEKPELRIGQPVRAQIKAMVIKDVYVIPRTAMRGINRVFLIDKTNNRINRTDIQPIWSNEEILLVREGIENGAWLATSRLPAIPNGAMVEIVEPSVAETAEGEVKLPGGKES